MKHLITLLLFFISFSMLAQDPVIERDVEEDRENAEPENMKTQFRWGANLGPSDNDSLSTLWSSGSWNIGGNGLIRVAKFYTLGINYGFQYDNLKIVPDSFSLLSIGQEVDKQHLHMYTGRVGVFNRFHIGKHGVKEGVYLDLGVAASIRITSRMRYQYETDPKVTGNQGAEEVDLLLKRLKYTELLGYYATAALGKNGVALYGEYRLSELFKQYESINADRKLPEIAPLNLGVRFEF